MFVCARLPDTLAAMVRSQGHDLKPLETSTLPVGSTAAQEQDARATLVASGGNAGDWLVVDHYDLDETWERQMRRYADRLLVLDDLGNRSHDCDMLLDQNLFENPEGRYAARVSQGCQLLLGPRYALLRDEFAACRNRVHPRSGAVRRALITFGGADPGNCTSIAIDAMESLVTVDVSTDVVIGTEHPNRLEIENRCRRPNFSLHVQTQRMAQLMAEADIAIAAGGSSTWERCCLGLPSLTVAIAENQLQVVRSAAKAGLLCELDANSMDAARLARQLLTLIEDSPRREAMSRAGMALIDGRGSVRVARALGFFSVSIRPASAADAADLFEWRNHPAVRSFSRTTAPLDWDEHRRWLGSVLGDPSRVLLIAESMGRAAGVVRFDIEIDVAKISIYAVPERNPAASGAEVLAAAEYWLRENRREIREFAAVVLDGNVASHRLFVAAGFERTSSTYRKRVR